jgi:hypothetical protein
VITRDDIPSGVTHWHRHSGSHWDRTRSFFKSLVKRDKPHCRRRQEARIVAGGAGARVDREKARNGRRWRWEVQEVGERQETFCSFVTLSVLRSLPLTPSQIRTYLDRLFHFLLLLFLLFYNICVVIIINYYLFLLLNKLYTISKL